MMRDANKSFSKIVQNALCVQRSFEFTLRKVITKWVNLMVYTSSCQKGQRNIKPSQSSLHDVNFFIYFVLFLVFHVYIIMIYSTSHKLIIKKIVDWSKCVNHTQISVNAFILLKNNLSICVWLSYFIWICASSMAGNMLLPTMNQWSFSFPLA